MDQTDSSIVSFSLDFFFPTVRREQSDGLVRKSGISGKGNSEENDDKPREVS